MVDQRPAIKPVRDMDGAPVWRIRVARGEHTCTRCGETSTDGYCLRRDDDDHADGQYDLIPTTDYLNPQEYELT